VIAAGKTAVAAIAAEMARRYEARQAKAVKAAKPAAVVTAKAAMTPQVRNERLRQIAARGLAAAMA